MLNTFNIFHFSFPTHCLIATSGTSVVPISISEKSNSETAHYHLTQQDWREIAAIPSITTSCGFNVSIPNAKEELSR